MKQFISILLALAGYLFTYYHAKVEQARESYIERLKEQLRDFYGPLLACVSATKAAYDAMLRQHSPDGSSSGLEKAIQNDPAGKEGLAYRQWIQNVLQPLNERASEIIFKHTDLLDSSEMEPVLLKLVAHVMALKVVITRWEQGEIDEWSVISYPDEILPYISKEFGRIKHLQSQLLGTFKKKKQPLQDGREYRRLKSKL